MSTMRRNDQVPISSARALAVSDKARVTDKQAATSGLGGRDQEEYCTHQICNIRQFSCMLLQLQSQRPHSFGVERQIEFVEVYPEIEPCLFQPDRLFMTLGHCRMHNLCEVHGYAGSGYQELCIADGHPRGVHDVGHCSGSVCPLPAISVLQIQDVKASMEECLPDPFYSIQNTKSAGSWKVSAGHA